MGPYLSGVVIMKKKLLIAAVLGLSGILTASATQVIIVNGVTLQINGQVAVNNSTSISYVTDSSNSQVTDSSSNPVTSLP